MSRRRGRACEWTRATSRRGTYGRPESGRVRSRVSSQPGSSSSIRITPRATGRSSPRHSSTISRRLRPGAEELGVDARRDDPIVAGEPLARGRGRALGRGDERVDPARAASRAAPSPAGSRAAPARRSSRPRSSARAQREVGEARQRRARSRGRGRSRRARARPSDSRASRPERPCCFAGRSAPPGRSRSPRRRRRRAATRRPVAEIGRAARRREHGDRVSELAQLGGDARDVVVHLVRRRPRERRDQAEPHGPNRRD